VKEIPNALDKISSIRGITFVWDKKDDPKYKDVNGTPSIAVSAEELDSLGLPDLVTKDEKGEYAGINMTGLVPVFKEKPKKENITLTKEELSLISQVLYRSQWNGAQWQQTITPLINKLAKMIAVVGGEK